MDKAEVERKLNRIIIITTKNESKRLNFVINRWKKGDCELPEDTECKGNCRYCPYNRNKKLEEMI